MTMRAFRVNDDIWRRAQLKAAEDGLTISDILRYALRQYIAEPSKFKPTK